MAACEICWGDSYIRSRLLGGSQVDHYYALLAERNCAANPCTCPTDSDIDAEIAAANDRLHKGESR